MSVIGAGLRSLPAVAILAALTFPIVGLYAIPGLAELLSPLICASGETIVRDTAPYIPHGESGPGKTLFCAGEAGTRKVRMREFLEAAGKVHAAIFAVIVWPVLTSSRLEKRRRQSAGTSRTGTLSGRDPRSVDYLSGQ